MNNHPTPVSSGDDEGVSILFLPPCPPANEPEPPPVSAARAGGDFYKENIVKCQLIPEN